MEYSDESAKKRNAFFAVALVLFIAGSAIAALSGFSQAYTIMNPDPALPALEGNPSALGASITGIIGLLNVVLLILLWNWRLWAYWGFVASSLVIFAIQTVGGGVPLSMASAGLVGPVIVGLFVYAHRKEFSS